MTSFLIFRGTIFYFVRSERSERRTKYDIVTTATKLTLLSLRIQDNLFYNLFAALIIGKKNRLYFEIVNHSRNA